MKTSSSLSLILLGLSSLLSTQLVGQATVGDSATRARSIDGQYISWREHIIDDPQRAGFALSGSDGLVVADIDRDGFEDVISVHESDSEYDSSQYDPDFVPPPEGHVRIAFASANPEQWTNITVAEGEDAPAPEDVDVADLNGDGYPDLVVAAELSHLIYLQNPGRTARSAHWPRLILPMTRARGSYIRVFIADLFGDARPEILAPNKGAQRPGPEDFARSTPVSVFAYSGDPLSPDSWQETIIGNYSIPQNSEPVDLDGDQDLDIVVGSRGENRLAWFENLSTADSLQLTEHAIGIVGAPMAGFNLEYTDLSRDGLPDIIGAAGSGIGWIEQPANKGDAWNGFTIGTFQPDSITGMEVADIDGDGDMDVIAGSYSRGPRTGDGDVDMHDALGRIGWFENPGDAKSDWVRHDISRRKRGMFDKFIARDLDGDGDVDFIGTRGNSAPFDGVFWLEQVRSSSPLPSFQPARNDESPEMPLP
jgi:hypothetical protein